VISSAAFGQPDERLKFDALGENHPADSADVPLDSLRAGAFRLSPFWLFLAVLTWSVGTTSAQRLTPVALF